MVTSAFPGVVDALISKLRTALPDVVVFDGIEPTNDSIEKYIVVGANDPEASDVTAGTASNEYISLGAKSMFENGTVNCVLVAQSGDTALADQRLAAFTLLNTVDTTVRSDTSLNGSCLYAGLGDTTTSYVQTTLGAAVEIAFTVNYRAKTNL